MSVASMVRGLFFTWYRCFLGDGVMDNIGGVVTSRHRAEVIALVKSLHGDEQAIAENVFLLGVFTAGRIIGAAQALHIAETVKGNGCA